MTQEEKLKEAKSLYKEANADQRYVLERLFPELKESEDERIRKAILNHLKKMWGNCEDDVCGIHVEDAIAWLEKQGEKLQGKSALEAIKEEKVDNQNCVKPSDNVEQKFNIGDEIKTANEEPLTITKIDEKGYWSEDLFICGFDDAAKWELVGQKLACSEVDEKMWLSTIEYVRTYPAHTNSVVDWLKSLKDRYTWKPSDEQMDTLKEATNIAGGKYKSCLNLLYQDLMKLKG